MKQKVIAIVGPTSSGKTALSVFLAKKLGGEIISADSRQVYKGLNVGTGKVTKKEMGGIPHWGLDIASPKKRFSAGDFVTYGQKALSRILENKRIPIVVGGTGLYVDSLLGRMTLGEAPPNPALREKLEKKSAEALFKQLQKLNPARAANIEPHHKRRLIRALEIAEYGRRITRASALRAARPSLTLASSNTTPYTYKILWLGIKPADAALRKKIATRLRARLKDGMLAEAKRLHAQGLSYKRMDELGLEYRSLARLLQDKVTEQEFETELERAIWQYAKRQWRWFKRNQNIHWVANRAEALQLAKKFVSGSKSPQSSHRARNR